MYNSSVRLRTSPLVLADVGNRVNPDRLCLGAAGLALEESAAVAAAEVANESILRITDLSAASLWPLVHCDSKHTRIYGHKERLVSKSCTAIYMQVFHTTDVHEGNLQSK